MAQQTNGTHTPLRVVVFDNMRVRSHIFSRLFSRHPLLKQVYHPYLTPAFIGPERITARIKHSERRRQEVEEEWLPLYVQDTYGSCTKQLEREVAEAENAVRVVPFTVSFFAGVMY